MPPPEHAQPPGQRLRGWIAVAVAMVIAIAAGVPLAWRLIDDRAAPAPVVAGRAVAASRPSASASTGSGQTLPSTLASPAGSAASAGTSDGSVPASNGSAWAGGSSVPAGNGSVPASGSPGPASGGPVPVLPSAAQQANAEQVAAFLGTYFAAINDRDYLTYIGLFEQSARPVRNAQQFASGFSTTTDSDPALVALAPTLTGGWAATVTFVSHQSDAASATDSSCTNWNLTLYLVPDGNSYLIGLPPVGYQPAYVAC